MTADQFKAKDTDQSNIKPELDIDIEIDLQSQTATFGGQGGAQRYSPGDTIGENYVLQDLIGRGGMGVVYRARHKLMDQLYAIKVLAPGQINDQSWKRFEVEGKALARLKHTNIVTIFNMAVDRGQFPFFVMEWLPGISLADHLRESGALSEEETIDIFLQVCAGLSTAHKSGIIHRDIKPGNIMLVPTQSGMQIKIVDFGMARLNPQQALTAVGEIFGSPLYMSPEQCAGKPMDGRSDIYSLGCSIFECLTGRTPFRGESALGTILMHLENEAPALSEIEDDTEYSADMEAVVEKCLSKDPDHRYQTIDQLAIDLQRIQVGKPVSRGFKAQKHSKLVDSFPLFEKDESQQVITGAATTSIWTNRTGNKAAFFVLAALFFISAAGAAAWLRGQNPDLPHTDLKLATEMNNGNTTGNIAADGYSNPTQVLEDLRKSPRVSQGIVVKDGIRQRYFLLPNIDIAQITSSSQEKIVGRGRVYCPVSERVCLRLNMLLNSYPQFITKFAPDDIAFLKLTEIDQSDIIFDQIASWTRLDTLAFDSGMISDHALQKLDQIKNLQNVILKRTIFSSPTFVKLKCLEKIGALRIEDCSNVNAVLQSLPVMPHLHHLELGGSNAWITVGALRNVARQKHLVALVVMEKKSQRARISGNLLDIETVERKQVKLPLLKYEDLTEIFTSMPNLKQLIMAKPKWTDSQITSFLKKVPAARCNQWARL